jgi:NAD-dependent dihydropyrimidine dehydrogenase PreA subunit
VAGSCIKDDSCIEVCPVDCIHPKPGDPDFEAAEQLYIDPELCIDCDACVEACTIDVIFADFELPLVTGDGGFTMWRRPGYGDFLAQRDPILRERQASGGAPEGFEDAVAWLVRISTSSPRTRPRTGARRSPSTTRTRSPSGPRSWVARCWRRRSTPRGCG